MYVDLQLFGGKGSSTTNTTSYTPTEYELQLQQIEANYANAIAPNSLMLNTDAANKFVNASDSVQANYGTLNNNAQSQIANAQGTVSNLINGELPSSYTDNMQSAIQSTLENTMGKSLNSLAGKGVLNSSVTNQALNDISKNAASTTAENYLNNISTLNGLAGQQSTMASQPITTTAAAQEAALQPSVTEWNMSTGLNSSTTGALSALSGQGTSTSTQKTSSGSGLLGGLVGGAASAYMGKII
ncbi:MAG: hypothetical protein PHS04_04180 [Tissierellia bacterium]|nr:hypothetical protein [Tissierellia bacterium]